MNSTNLNLYITAEHECGYYDNRLTSNLIPDPTFEMSANLYDFLIQKGFRRSGGYVYRPHCKDCLACIACRINIKNFSASKNQRRCLKKNNDLTTHIVDARFTDEYFSLYKRYLEHRHEDGSMANPTADEFKSFLLNNWGTCLFIESRLNGRLLSVAVVDFLISGPSAVYTFFEPQESRRSLGTFAILQQLWLSKLYNKQYLYLGYWIEQHPKMDYKRKFSGLEIYQQEQWLDFKLYSHPLTKT